MRWVVLDTNVLVSALLSPFGPPGRILDLVLSGKLAIAFDDRLLAEYRDVLTRPRFGFDRADVFRLLTYLTTTGLLVAASPWSEPLPDPDDAMFLEVAAAAGATLVTGNLKHFPPDHRRGVDVRSPADFLASWPDQDT